ncbi:hypothetical protein SAMN04487830_1236 [Pseudobutyrivibrio sp. OR37]|uniref:hypothetical protein n=1 Tax=Pseudobutyrivibrio sp. OR37 TaxID=1798186 RepID=UPI0008E9CC25|nr:hypothetical protein [Pseudobutyrivibrio sp. OR37]SFI11299.1 hypothetical protein SAMN04487830_1236 [Pseudobutyrivibrio sp. OR37]
MAVVIIAALVLYVVEFVTLAQLHKEANELKNDDLVFLENAFGYTYIDEDFEQVEAEILKLKEELRYAI